MKKVMLFFAVAAIAFGVNAQTAATPAKDSKATAKPATKPAAKPAATAAKPAAKPATAPASK